MIKKTNIFIFVFFIAVFVAVHLYFYMPSRNSSFEKGFSAQNGVADLKFWHSDSTLLELDGNWEFHYGSLLSPGEFEKNAFSNLKYSYVPRSWERIQGEELSPDGYATYRLIVTGLHPGQIYGFYIYEQANSFKLWINGNFCASNGAVATDEENYVPEWNPVLGTFTADINGSSEFVIQIASYSYNRGGFWNPIKIGSVPNIVGFREKKIFSSIFLLTVIFLASIVFFIFFLIDNFNRSVLYFSLFTFFIALRLLLIEERIIKSFTDLPWWLTTRVEYLAGYVLLPLFGLFFIRFFRIDYKNMFMRTFAVLLIFAFLLTIFTPARVYTVFFPCYKMLLIVSLFYFLYVLVVSIRRKISGSFIALIGSVFIGAAVVRDVVTESHYSMVSTGVFVFLTCYSFILMQKFLYLIRQKGRLEEKLNTDLLTGLHNRHYFIEHVKNRISMLNKDACFYIMFIDLDKFKCINDNFGHEAGDEVLRCIGARLRSVFRDDDVISRFGGDEFLIYIENKTDAVIMELSRRIIQTVAKPIISGDNSFEVGMSVGISKFPDDGVSVEELIIMSDSLMYKAKKKGGCRSEMVTAQNYAF